MQATPINAADALKLFARAGIKVQEAKPVKKEVDGRVRTVMETKDVPLAEEHILGARRYANGLVTITTIDGQRHEARGRDQEPEEKKGK